MNSPLVSIGIPTYNRPHSFKKALDSIVNQTYKNIEIIIGDNSDNYETKDIMEEYVSDSRIKYKKHETNIGSLKNVQFLLNNANGKYFMFTADDDYWDITFIEKAVEKLEADPEAVACWSDVQFFDNTGNINMDSSFHNQDVSKYNTVNRLIKINMQSGWYEFYCLVKTNIIKSFNFNEFKMIGTDVVFINHLLLSGKCLMINEPLFHYFVSSTHAYERYNYKSEIYNEYARINPHLDNFVKCFQLILKSNKINIFQKLHYYIKYWINIIFINQLWIQCRFIVYPPISEYFKLVIKKRDFGIILICMPLLLHLLLKKSTKQIKEKIKNALYRFSIYKFYTHSIKKNTVLLLEFNPCHIEVMPGYAKYLIDLGFNVDTIMIPKMSKERVFCRYKHKNLRHYVLDVQDIKKLLYLKKIHKYSYICITSWHLYIARKNQAFFNIFPDLNIDNNKFIFVIHEKDNLDDFSKCFSFISLAHLECNKYMPTVVNPHYFGAIQITPKNEDVIHFIVVGNVDSSKRDYELINNACIYLLDLNITNFKITIIGNGEFGIADTLKNYINYLGCCDYPTMFKCLEQADFFLALLNPDDKRHDDYLENKTSGSFQLCYGFLKPIILAEKFAIKLGFANNDSIIYKNNHELGNSLKKAITMSQEEYKYIQDNLLELSTKIYAKSISNFKILLKGN